MSVFIPVVEQPRHARPKPDLRLAESYLPAVVLYIKCLGYTGIAPIILLMQWRLTVLCVAAFALLLYVDHLYLSHGMIPFIDTTALCLDVFGSTLLMLAISLLRPCSQQCQGILALWTLLGCAYVLCAQLVPRALAHACAFTLALLFIYADAGSGGAITVAMNQTLAGMSQQQQPLQQPLSFFSRTTLYVLLGLVDIYLFRPLFQQENERLLFCKYAPVLLGTWPWYIVFGLFLGTAQLAKHLRLLKIPSVSSSTLSSGAGGAAATAAASGGMYNGGHSYFSHPQQHSGDCTLSSSNNSTAVSAIPPILLPPASAFGSAHKSIQELDVMEAFRLAKEQRMGAKGAN
jgi:hypothetical protein